MFERRQRRRRDPAGDVRPLPRLAHQRRHPRRPLQFPRHVDGPVRARLGHGDRARGRPRGRSSKAAQGRRLGAPRRPLARRLADRRLRGLGLQRRARLQGRRRAGADRRRPAGQLRRVHLERGAGAGRDARDERARSSTCSGSASPRPPACSPRSAASTHSLDPTAPATTLQNFPLLPADFKPPVPVDEPGPVRLRVRPRHLAAVPRPAARQRGRARRTPATRATGSTAASPRSPASPRPSARSRPTRSSGTSRAG